VYNDKINDRVVGIHTEGPLASQIVKAQPMSPQQLRLLREFNVLD